MNFLIIYRCCRRAIYEIIMIFRQVKALFFSTYHFSSVPRLHSYFSAIDLDSIEESYPLIEISHLYTRHYFSLLGSGWVKNSYGIRCQGVEGSIYSSSVMKPCVNLANRRYSMRVQSLISDNYNLIDWQRDFKSGFRWSEKTWYSKIKYGENPGVDIKLPWELARMQHLVNLALSFKIKKENIFLVEFCDQILDFISANPPRFGVNWRCTMDVSIRIANCLISYDIFLISGAEFSPKFEKIFFNSVYDHAIHIINNLEWYHDSIPRSNHYLADIVGLLYAAAYLPSTQETDAWLSFSIQELLVEVDKQFHKDGSSVEGSTSYHRLSSEMVFYATALVLKLPKSRFSFAEKKSEKLVPRLKNSNVWLYSLPGSDLLTPFPFWYFERLYKMSIFSRCIVKPDGQFVQVGDNDSGRFVKVFPGMDKLIALSAKRKYKNLQNYSDLPNAEVFWDESVLDYRYLFSIFKEFFYDDECPINPKINVKEGTLIKCLLSSYSEFPLSIKVNSDFYNSKRFEFIKKDLSLSSEYEFISNSNILEGLKNYAFTGFGLYVYKSKDFYLHIRCGGEAYGTCGHFHCDQMSLELFMDGKAILSDAGSYLYTSSKDKRNIYRSCKYHTGISFKDRDCVHIDKNSPFRFISYPFAECLYFNSNIFLAKIKLFGVDVFREVCLYKNKIIVRDYLEKKYSHSVMLDNIHKKSISFSPGYGKQVRSDVD